MRVLTFGSLNIDEVYRVRHFVRPGETLASDGRSLFCGGKGLNQAIALARAGADVCMAGCVGADGGMLTDALKEAGVDVSLLCVSEQPTGRAVIQVDESGQNAILLLRGANGCVREPYIRQTLSRFSAGDWLLLQNETSGIRELLQIGSECRMRIAFNPSPMDETVPGLPLEQVSCFLLNETEGEALSGRKRPEEMLSALRKRYPNASVVLTLGGDGAYYADESERFFQPAERVNAVDTTCAGDTFTGYFLAARAQGQPPRQAMALAAHAAAIAVTRHGASVSIPTREETEQTLRQSEI